MGKGWTDTGELECGDQVVTKSGARVRVDSLTRRSGLFKVYNFEVANSHSYFVGKLGLLVHNNNGCTDILMPNGQPIGTAGSKPSIREVKGDLADAQKMFDELTQGGQVANKPTYTGTWMNMPDGSGFGLRTKMAKSPGTVANIDVNVPNVPIGKIKFNPF